MSWKQPESASFMADKRTWLSPRSLAMHLISRHQLVPNLLASSQQLMKLLQEVLLKIPEPFTLLVRGDIRLGSWSVYVLICGPVLVPTELHPQSPGMGPVDLSQALFLKRHLSSLLSFPRSHVEYQNHVTLIL